MFQDTIAMTFPQIVCYCVKIPYIFGVFKANILKKEPRLRYEELSN